MAIKHTRPTVDRLSHVLFEVNQLSALSLRTGVKTVISMDEMAGMLMSYDIHVSVEEIFDGGGNEMFRQASFGMVYSTVWNDQIHLHPLVTQMIIVEEVPVVLQHPKGLRVGITPTHEPGFSIMNVAGGESLLFGLEAGSLGINFLPNNTTFSLYGEIGDPIEDLMPIHSGILGPDVIDGSSLIMVPDPSDTKTVSYLLILDTSESVAEVETLLDPDHQPTVDDLADIPGYTSASVLHVCTTDERFPLTHREQQIHELIAYEPTKEEE